MESANGKQVIARAAAILNTLADDPKGLSLGQISQATGLPRTTVHRLVGSLEAQQLVRSGPQGIRLGAALARLAAAAHTDILSLARPSLESLSRRTRETVDLCVYRGQHAVSVAQYASDQELRVVSPVGTAFPIHCTAHGKALLARLPNAHIQATLGATLEKRTAATLTETATLLKQLEEIRHTGHALDHEEHALGVCGMGVPLRTGQGEHYALSLAVPAQRFYPQQAALLAALRQCQAEIEALLGLPPQA